MTEADLFYEREAAEHAAKFDRCPRGRALMDDLWAARETATGQKADLIDRAIVALGIDIDEGREIALADAAFIREKLAE